MRPELQDVVDEAARVLGAPVTLEDRDFQLVAFAAHPGPVDAVRHASILRRRSSTRIRAHFEGYGIATSPVPVHVPAAGAGPGRIAPRLCLPARARGVTYGYLWALEDAGPVDSTLAAAAMRLADRAGSVLAQQARARDDVAWLLDDLLSADAEAAARAADALDERGLAGRRAPAAVVVVRGAAAPAALWGLPRSVLTAPAPDGVTLLVPAGSAGTPGPTVLDVAHRAVGIVAGPADVGAPPDPSAARVVAGIGEAVADLAAARESLRHARVAARVAADDPTSDPVRRWGDLGVHRLLACGAGTLADALLDDGVDTFLAADPELVRTARCWLDAGCSAHRAARALGVHRQTLYARLARVEQLTGTDLASATASGADRTRLHLALTLAPLLRGASPGGTGAPRRAR